LQRHSILDEVLERDVASSLEARMGFTVSRKVTFHRVSCKR
jgi:hypothetical protein